MKLTSSLISKNASRVYRKCPSVTQILEAECGPAALSMLLGHYKKFVPLGVLTSECCVTRDGTSASKLIEVASKFSLKLQGKGYRWERLKESEHMPCMALWNYSHWIVVEGFNEEGFYINDPATGRRFELNENFANSYSHMCLLGEPLPGFSPSGNRFKEDIDMFNTWKPVLKDIVLITLFASIVALPNLVVAFVTGAFAQNVLQDGWKNWYVPSVSLLFLMSLLMTGIKFYQYYFQRRVRIKLLKVAIENFFNSVLEKNIEFYDQRQPGEVASRLGQLTNAVLLTTGEFVDGTSSILTLFIYLFAIFLIHPLIFVGLIIPVLLYLTYLVFVGPTLIDKSKQVAVAGGYAYSSTLSAIDSVNTVKSMSLQVGALDSFLTSFNKQTTIKQELTLLSQSIDAFSGVITNVMKLVLIALGSHLVIIGEMQLSSLVTISMLLQVIDPAIKNSVTYIRDLGTSYGDIARFADIYHDRSRLEPDVSQFAEYDSSEITFEQSSRKLITRDDRTNLDIVVQSNSMFYFADPKKYNFGFVDELTLSSGNIYQLEGGHGVGKTTFSKLLLGDIDFQNGGLVYNLTDKGDINHSYKQIPNSLLCSYLNEGVSFFPGPLSDSITYFGQLHNLESFTDIAAQLEITHLIDTIPGKLSYQLNATGTNISSRLLKMLEVVRTLAISPDLVVFDYALDDLDLQFRKNVLKYLKKSTSIAILISNLESPIESINSISITSIPVD